MEFDRIVESIGLIIDGAGVAIIAGGIIVSTIIFIARFKQATSYKNYRRTLGKTILLGLEFLVAGDIIRTVVIRPSFTSIGILGLIVLIRSVLSIELEREVTGKWPWASK